MADTPDDQDYFAGLGQTLAGKAGLVSAPPAGLGAALVQGSPAMPTAPSVQNPSAAAHPQGGGNSPPQGYISIAYYKGLGGNPVGHMGVSVGGGPYYGREPSPGLGLLPMIGHEPPEALQTLTQLGIPVPGEVDMIPASRVPADVVKIPASADQLEQARQYMLKQTGPNFYNLPVHMTDVPTNDCVTYAAGALNSTGLRVPQGPLTALPQKFIEALHKLYDPSQTGGQPGH